MLWETMTEYLKSWFNYSGLAVNMLLIGIAVALAFGAIWLLAHWPPLFKQHRLWAVLVASAFLTLLAIVFVQIPLQWYASKALSHYWDSYTLYHWMLLAGLPSLIISGFVQEGAKMVPMVFWWWRSGKTITPQMGLAIGALAGAGFGIFEATWAHGQTFLAGWTWDVVRLSGLTQGLLPFWERFWAVAMHIAVSALVGYGLAKGKGWQFYILASVLHAAVNFLVLPYRRGMITLNQVEIYLAAGAALITLVVLWLRWIPQDDDTVMTPVIPIPPPPGPEKPDGVDV
ncbi:MAG: YhfC family glutamic-type intramembrane protease [Dehalococcoidales bacterium]|jgi:RsiW-degrading membrane proteinase PrsW (M82 family)